MKAEYAKLMGLYSIACDYCRENKHNNSAAEYARKLNDEIEAKVAADPTSFNIDFTGYEEDDDISHYDIDDALDRHFGERISTDSEGSQFFAYCNESDKEEVATFLKEKYPTLDFSYEVSEYPQCRYFSNGYAAKEYCKENEIELKLPQHIFDDPLTKDINYIDGRIAELEEAKAKLIADATGK